MIVSALAHLIFATTILQIVPIDASDVENRVLSTQSFVPVSVYNASSFSTARLPMARNVDQAPTKRKINSIGVVTTAVSALVLDRQTHTVLFQKNINEPRSIGSITKLMTALVVLESGIDLQQRVTLLAEDLRFGGVQHLSINDTYTVQDLLYASLVSSDNTATAALARLSRLSMGDFVARMNEEAAEIGMEYTQFVDPTGLSAKNQSVVYDIARLLDEVAQNAWIRTMTQTSTVFITGGSGRVYELNNTDELLSSFVNQPPFKIEAAKTGFLPEAGYCLGTLFSNEGGREIIVVVLGSNSDAGRFQDVKALAAWAYETYQWETS